MRLRLLHLFLVKHIDLIPALLHHVRDDNLALVTLSNFDTVARDRFKSLFLLDALRSVNNMVKGPVRKT